MSKAVVWLAGGAVAVAAAGAGSMVVTGNKIEARMTTETKAVLDKFAPLVTVQDLKYEKTFTGATRTLTVKLGCGAEAVPVTWRDQIQHGPLPGFKTVGGAVIDSEFVVPEDIKTKLKDTLGLETAPLTVHTVVGLGGATASDLTVASVKSKLPDGVQLSWQGLTVHAEKNGEQVRYEGKMPSVDVVDPNQGIMVKMTGYAMRGESSAGKYWWAFPGSSSGDLASLELVGKDDSGEEFKFLAKDVKLSSKAVIENDLLSTSSDLSGVLEINGQKIDKVQMQASAKRLHMPTLDEVVTALLNQDTLKTMCSGKSPEEAVQQRSMQMAAELPAKLLKLLPHNPEYGLDKLAVTYQGKEAVMGYMVGVDGVTADEAKQENLKPLVLFKKVVASAHARLPVAWIKLIANATKGEGEAPTDEEINAMLAPAIAQGFIVREGEYLVTKATLKGGKANVNGKDVPIPGLAAAQ